MKKLILSASIALLLLSATTPAAACYNALQFEAAQGLRIQSELMVIGLTCIKMPGGQALYDNYLRFSRKNAGLLGDYRAELLDHYRADGIFDPQKKLDALRTSMANDVSRMAINMSTLTFCQTYASHITEAVSMDNKTVRRWAEHVWPGQPSPEPLCRQ